MKKFKAEQASAQAKYNELASNYNRLQTSLQTCNDEKAELRNKTTGLETEVSGLNKQLEFVKANSTQTLKQLEDLSVISAQQAANIRKSLENIGAKDLYIQNLQESLARKDSLNLTLVMNLKGAIGNLEDQDINVKVEKGVVFIDISDKLLFESGKYEITRRAQDVLGKVAKVLKAQPDLEYMIEGHTDNVPFEKNGALLDNWDLSVKRATAVVRVLQTKYGLDPAKMIAAGRGEYKPLVANADKTSKQTNRRTRIMVLPQMDQFFKLLERK
jgi:chemotaxis protein MotB